MVIYLDRWTFMYINVKYFRYRYWNIIPYISDDNPDKTILNDIHNIMKKQLMYLCI